MMFLMVVSRTLVRPLTGGLGSMDYNAILRVANLDNLKDLFKSLHMYDSRKYSQSKKNIAQMIGV